MILIRPVDPADVEAVAEVNAQAFGGEEESRLVRLLHARGKACISLLAETDGGVVGHILFSPAYFKPDQPQLQALGLAPIAVLPAYQNQGIGSQLVISGLLACRSGGWQAVFVLGHPTYYPRFGFRPAHLYAVGNEYGVDEAFMALELQPRILEGIQAMACYAPEFGELGE